MFVGVIVLTVLAAFFVFFTVRFFKIRRDFSGRGKHTTAKVIDAAERGHGSHFRYIYKLEYMVDDKLQTAECTVGASYRHEVGETVEIAYMPEEPERVMLIKDIVEARFGGLYVAMCVLILGFLAYFVVMSFEQGGRETFFELCASGTAQQIEGRIKAGADVNAKDSRKSTPTTPLIIAAKNNKDPEVLRLLLQAGAVGDKNWLLGRAAEYNSNPEVLLVLIQAGADVNAKGYAGITPLLSATGNSNPEVSRALIQAGADVNAKTDRGETPLMSAALIFNNPEVLNVLIEAGADVNAKNNEGQTALNYAVRKNKPEIVSLLLAAGTAVSENDLELAQKNERLKDTAVIEELKSKLSDN